MSDDTKDTKGGEPEGGQPTAPESEGSKSVDSPREGEVQPEAGPEKPSDASSESPPDGPSAEEEAAAKAKAAAEAKAKAEAAAKAKAAHEAAEAAKDPWERDPVVPEWKEADDDPLVEALQVAHPASIENARTLAGDLTLQIRRDDIRDVCKTLKAAGYVLPVDICGAHYPDREEGEFEVIYHLYSLEANRRIRLKVATEAADAVPSVTPVWVGANWHEREVYDMFGVRFADHPDMTRILLWEGFNGYPLRKDFPVEGIDTGSAIYPEYYEEQAGPIAGTGTGWKSPEPPEPEPEPEAEAAEETGEGA